MVFCRSSKGHCRRGRVKSQASRSAAVITINVNGASRQIDIEPDTPLLWVLRDVIGLTGTKFGCGVAQCGACTVHLNGQPVRSCVLPVGAIGNRSITTIEGVGATSTGQKIQQAWLQVDVVQ